MKANPCCCVAGKQSGIAAMIADLVTFASSLSLVIMSEQHSVGTQPPLQQPYITEVQL